MTIPLAVGIISADPKADDEDASAGGGPNDRRRTDAETRRRLREVALLFLRLGTTAFGGPAAHIAMMEDEVVRRRAWMTREHFLDLLGATNLIPGPNSTEMAMHIGHRRAGWTGLIVAGACFIIPASLITLALARAYVKFGTRPQAGALLYGVKPVIIAIVVQALWGLGRTALKSTALATLAFAAAAACALGANELLVLIMAGVVAMAGSIRIHPRWRTWGFFPAALPAIAVSHFPAFAAVNLATAVAAPFNMMALFLLFLKVGAVLFGSGYVLLAFLQADLVDHRHWLTVGQLLDAIAIGQITPGPVFSTATFVGYVLGGAGGAVIATVGIFLPSFVFVAMSGPFVPRLRRSRAAGAFLDGVNVGALALMAVVTITLAQSAIVDVTTVLLAAASAFLLMRVRVNSAWLVLGGAGIGLALRGGLQ